MSSHLDKYTLVQPAWTDTNLIESTEPLKIHSWLPSLAPLLHCLTLLFLPSRHCELISCEFHVNTQFSSPSNIFPLVTLWTQMWPSQSLKSQIPETDSVKVSWLAWVPVCGPNSPKDFSLHVKGYIGLEQEVLLPACTGQRDCKS